MGDDDEFLRTVWHYDIEQLQSLEAKTVKDLDMCKSSLRGRRTVLHPIWKGDKLDLEWILKCIRGIVKDKKADNADSIREKQDKIESAEKLCKEVNSPRVPESDVFSIKLNNAVQDCDIEKVKYYLKLGADPNIKNSDGDTPLHVAASRGRGYKDIVELLLNHGANPNVKNDDGATPLYWAAFYGDKDIVELLLKSGADPNVKNSDGDTPLLDG